MSCPLQLEPPLIARKTRSTVSETEQSTISDPNWSRAWPFSAGSQYPIGYRQVKRSDLAQVILSGSLTGQLEANFVNRLRWEAEIRNLDIAGGAPASAFGTVELLVPEPSTALLLSGGLLGLAVQSRRRKTASQHA